MTAIGAKGVELILRELHRGESDMTGRLRRAAERHAEDYEVAHGATELARWSAQSVRRLAEAGSRHGLDLAAAVDGDGPLRHLREAAADALARRPEPALLMLQDLRELHDAAARNAVNWLILTQTAKALRDGPLVDLARTRSPLTTRQMQWTETLIKASAAQTLTSLS